GGEPLVKNRLAVTLTLSPQRAHDKKLVARLSRLLGMSVGEIDKQVRSVKINPIEPRVIKRDVPKEVMAYIEEHDADFVGVELKVEAIRDYPNGGLAAHIVGYLGELSDSEQKERAFSDYSMGDLVGKSGIERQYENVLSGSKGTEYVEVNAAGRPIEVIDKKEPDPGNNVVLTIDKRIQASAEAALAATMAAAKKTKYPRASAGAIVVTTPTGEVVAMASWPTYDPRIFVGGVSTAQWATLTDKKSEYPLSNRAIMSGYPAGSTFKVVTAIAGFKTGVLTTGTTVLCRGRWTGLGTRWAKWCWDRAGHGVQSVEGALRVSCDTFFYETGYRIYRLGGEDLQKWARRLGFGSPTGIDLPAEAAGRVPTAAWKKAWNKNWPANQTWFPGDTVNLAIGQGDLLVTPLQLADVYAAIANGGSLYKPRIVKSVIGLDGRKIYEAPDKIVSRLDLTAGQMAALRRGLRRVVVDGTAAGAFAGFPVQVSGKTSTAEVVGKDDLAGFVGYAPSDNPKYIVAVVIEQGGHGGAAAAPAARRILADIFNVNEDKGKGIGTVTDNSR
ncbi:MAG: penicillin-binding protein 2, partial [Actinomycetota bacterium]|nr:penicillin-binding protein 2 [Actinomycetota bacterium]